jgi:cytochrome c-type biogenesis protein
VSGSVIVAASALWLGILTSLSPCPLATNITAISFVGRRTGSPVRMLLTGLLYTVGRTLVYIAMAALLVTSVMSSSAVSLTLQNWMNKLLGPILILVGMVMFGLLRFRVHGRGMSGQMQRRVERWGLLGALALGMLFALSFCPVSAALFFGSLLPLAVKHNSAVFLPFLFGVGTAIPVVVFAAILAFGARWLGKAFERLTLLERWMRVATGAVFIGIGIYMSLVHVYHVL